MQGLIHLGKLQPIFTFAILGIDALETIAENFEPSQLADSQLC